MKGLLSFDTLVSVNRGLTLPAGKLEDELINIKTAAIGPSSIRD